MEITIVHTVHPSVIETLNRIFGSVKVLPETSTNGTVPKRSRKPAEMSAAIETEEAETETTAAAATSAITVEALRLAVQAKTKDNDAMKAKVRTLLGEFGSESVSKLGKEHYADFHAKLQTL